MAHEIKALADKLPVAPKIAIVSENTDFSFEKSRKASYGFAIRRIGPKSVSPALLALLLHIRALMPAARMNPTHYFPPQKSRTENGKNPRQSGARGYSAKRMISRCWIDGRLVREDSHRGEYSKTWTGL